MGGRDALDPAVDLEVAGGDEAAHALAQHLDARSGHGVDARVAQRGQGGVEPDAGAVREIADILRTVGVQMDAGSRGLHRPRDVEIARGVVLRRQEPLHAELGGTEVPGVGGDRADVVEREGRRVIGGDGAEPGGREIAVDDERDRLAHGVAAHVVGGGGEDVEIVARRLQELDPLGVVEGERVFRRGLGQAPDARRAVAGLRALRLGRGS